MYNMTNLYIPVCGFCVALLLIVLFFVKERVKNQETKFFSGMLITSFLDSILMILIIFIAYVAKDKTDLLKWLNKLDYMQFLLWIWFFFMYILYITYKDDKKGIKIYKRIIKISSYVNIISVIAINVLDVSLYNENNIMYSYGASANFLYFICAVYLSVILITLITNAKKIFTKK